MATKKDKLKNLVWVAVGLAFVISGANGILRTYCLNQSSARHVIHLCIVSTTPVAYLGSITVLLIGVFLLFFEKIFDWMLK
jgi:hypothetical protein